MRSSLTPASMCVNLELIMIQYVYLPYSVKYGKITITHEFQIIQSYLIL